MSSQDVNEALLSQLLDAGDPAPVTVVNPSGSSSAVIICDNVGDAIPIKLDGL